MSNPNKLDPLIRQLELLKQNQTDVMHYLGKDYNKEELIKLSIDFILIKLRNEIGDLKNYKDNPQKPLSPSQVNNQEIQELQQNLTEGNNRYLDLLQKYKDSFAKNQKIEKKRKQIQKQTSDLIESLKKQNGDYQKQLHSYEQIFLESQIHQVLKFPKNEQYLKEFDKFIKSLRDAQGQYDNPIKKDQDAINQGYEDQNENQKVFKKILAQIQQVSKTIDKMIHDYSHFIRTKKITDIEINSMLENNSRILQNYQAALKQFQNILIKMFEEKDILEKKSKYLEQENSKLNQESQQQLFSVQQVVEQFETVKLQLNNNNLININKQLFEKIQEKNDLEIYLRQMLEDQNNEMQIILFNNQIKFVYDNSLKIDENNNQFKEKIENINTNRDQIIRDMEDTVKQFEQIKSKNLMRQNQYLDIIAYQNFKNKIKSINQIIVQLDMSLDKFVIELNEYLKNTNNSENQIIKDLTSKLNLNIKCFQSVKNALNELVKMLDQIQETNLKYNVENKELQKQLENIQKENSEIQDNFQINQLDELHQQEQQLITDLKINCQKQDCLDISNKYTNLQNQIYNDIIPEINIILQITFKLYLIENKQNPSNQELLHKIQDYINDNDNVIEQSRKGLNLLMNMSIIPLNQSIANKYINQTLQKIMGIWQKISEFKKEFDSLREKIEKSETNATNE